MASVKKDRIPEIANFMQDFWQLIKDFWSPENSDRYWESLVARQDELAQKYNNHDFVLHMLCAITNYLEETANAQN